ARGRRPRGGAACDSRTRGRAGTAAAGATARRRSDPGLCGSWHTSRGRAGAPGGGEAGGPDWTGARAGGGRPPAAGEHPRPGGRGGYAGGGAARAGTAFIDFFVQVGRPTRGERPVVPAGPSEEG